MADASCGPHAPRPFGPGPLGSHPLFVEVREPTAASASCAPVVVLVHGSLDRSASFRRVARRLVEARVVLYDRRGYQRSREAGPTTGVEGHVEDLSGLIDTVAADGLLTGPLVVVGHSFGGDVALGAAARRPGDLAAVGAYEPPLPWLGFRGGRRRGEEVDPGDHAERFFRRMVSDSAWERLGAEEKASRRADGPALSAELSSIREHPPFDVDRLRLPVVLGRGGAGSAPHHRRGVAWLAEQLPHAEVFEVGGAAHGVHLSHPDALAALVRRTLRVGGWHGAEGASAQHEAGHQEAEQQEASA
jgi:pimeloyl-ACP methyl ester carboxylesterase